jgi:hypothetical protein
MKAVRVNRFLMPLLVVVTLLGSVWVAKATGLWQTSGRGQVLLDASGQPDSAGIKGWMTLIDVSETYGVPLDALYVLIGADPGVPPETAMKDLEKLVPDMEVWAVREGVAAYLAGAWTPEMGRFEALGIAPEQGEAHGPGAPTAVPSPTAAPAPTATPQPTPQPTGEHVPQGQGLGQGQGEGAGSGFVLPQDGSRLPGAEIRGRMTLQEVVDYCQVPLDYLIAELGLPDDVDVHLRMSNLASQMGVEVVTVRDAVTRYQEQP